MKLSKKLLAIGLSVGLAVSAVIPVFAANETDPVHYNTFNKLMKAIESKTYTADEKAKAMALAEDIVDGWDDVNFASRNAWLYADGVKVDVWYRSGSFTNTLTNGATQAANNKAIMTPALVVDAHGNFAGGTIQMTIADYVRFHKDDYDDYRDQAKSDFYSLVDALKLDGLVHSIDQFDMEFLIYADETNVTDEDDYLVSITASELLASWTNEGSFLNDLRTALGRAKTGTADDKKDDKKDDKGTAATTTCVTCNTTTTTTTTTSTAAAAPAGTGNAGKGLPLANTATNYGNVMALGLGAMVVALGVFAYSKKVTA